MQHSDILTEGIDWVARFCDIPENDAVLQAILNDFCERMGFALTSLVTYESPEAFDYRASGYIYFSSTGKKSCPGRIQPPDEEVECQCLQILKASNDLRPRTWISDNNHPSEDFPCLAITKGEFFRITHLPIHEGKRILGVLHLFEHSENPVSGIAHDVLFSLIPLLGKQLRRRLDTLKNRREREFLMSAFSYSPDASVLVNSSREVLVANPAMLKTFGYEASEIIGKKTTFLYETEELFLKLGDERFNLTAMERDKPYTVNYRRKDGRLFAGETVGTVVHNRAGEVIGYQALIRDISERTTVEQEFRQRKALFRTIFDSVPCAVFVTGKSKLITHANRAASKLYGMTVDQMVGREFKHFRANREEYLVQVGANSKTDYLPSHGETLVFQRRSDGSIFPAILAGGPVYNEEAQLQGYITIVDDISSRVGVESRLKQSNHRLQSMLTSRTEELDDLHARLSAKSEELESLAEAITQETDSVTELAKDAASLQLTGDLKLLVGAIIRALGELRGRLSSHLPNG